MSTPRVTEGSEHSLIALSHDRSGVTATSAATHRTWTSSTGFAYALTNARDEEDKAYIVLHTQTWS